MKFEKSRGNKIEFIREGANFFGRLQELFREVRAARPANDTYLRLAFWEIDCTLPLPDRRRLDVWLKDVADAGHPVDVITWCPARLDVHFDKALSAGIKKVNDTFAKAVAGYDPRNETGHIRVLQEIYNGWNGSSTHQKIVIASIGGKLKVLIGGMNLASFYYDDATHNGVMNGGMGGPPLGNTIHDTAVQIEGPSAIDVETEWLRRYEKRFYTTQLSASAGGLTDPPDDPLDYQRLAKANVKDQTPRGPNATIEVRTTNSESYFGRDTHIQERLVELIRSANDYVYLEGFVISDPTLIYELCQRLAKKKALKVIIMVPQPYEENPFPFDYLNYISFAKLALASCDEVKIKGGWIKRADCSAWKLNESYNFWSTLRSITSTVKNAWLENDSFSCTLKVGGKTHTTPLLDIEDFRGGVRFYSPKRRHRGQTHGIYIHSKLALVDDAVAVIGSANFSYRSQVYDGEISAFIEGPEVANIRADLLTHWGLRGGINQFMADLSGGGTHWVDPLEVSDYPKKKPADIDASYGKINHTFI